jgi:hypothetical protein
MTAYYLSSYIGSGTLLDPFRPITAVPGWSAIDLRPDSSLAAGRCLVATPDPISERLPLGVVDLGQGENLTVARKSQIGNALGVTISKTSFSEVIAELLIDLAGGSRWKPLVPSRIQNFYRSEIYLGGLLWSREIPVIAGGASASDNFDRADSTTIGGTWLEDLANWSIASNKVTNNGNGDSELRNTSALSTNDQFAQVLANSIAFRGVGAFVRHPNSTTRTYYSAQCFGTASRELYKRVSGTSTALASPITTTITYPTTIGVEARGSTIRGMWDGSEYLSATDTAIASGPHTGIFMYNAGSVATADDFLAGDIITSGNFFSLF